MTRIPYTDGGSDFDASDPTSELSAAPGEDETPSIVVVRAVATLTNTSPIDLDPLYHAIDPDHLDRVVQSADESAVRMEISFRYQGCEVTVTEDEIRVRTAF
ncbi:HalOD1 output domain-containing protein [Halosolutus gelatinilyticus]|uniref:HalOD1 output domain-containing protein n=1 Tax=Halosolutus gelatinilyticus TaxID=2931975 RepID=UPI001FF1CF98|nr:HalOD1 output domain-containing protein [Halosolutus gelatinilyticus]